MLSQASIPNIWVDQFEWPIDEKAEGKPADVTEFDAPCKRGSISNLARSPGAPDVSHGILNKQSNKLYITLTIGRTTGALVQHP
jgi:hypothetical protein